MATRGRKPLPSGWHILRGTKTKEQVANSGEPKPAPITPKCPSWLAPEAKKLWKRLVPELQRIGVLTMVDGEALAAACQNWAVYVETERFFKRKDPATGKPYGRTYAYTNKAGATNILPRPEVAIGQRALAEFRAFCAEFGLTPASRTRINVNISGLNNGEDPMEALLDQGG